MNAQGVVGHVSMKIILPQLTVRAFDHNHFKFAIFLDSCHEYCNCQSIGTPLCFVCQHVLYIIYMFVASSLGNLETVTFS